MTSRLSEKVRLEKPGMQIADDGGEDDDVLSGEDDGAGDVFFCVAATSRGSKRRMSYFLSNAAAGEDAEAARELAALCLGHAPEHHAWHHHTVAGRRTFAFLAAGDGRTYLAVADPTPGGAETVRFLERVRDACDAAAPPRRWPRDGAVVPVARQFVRSLRAAARTRTVRTMTRAPSADANADAGEEKDEDEEAQHGWPHHRSAPARRPEPERLLSWRRPWWQRHAMAVIVVDLVLCLVLFVVWTLVCHGFRCVQR